MARDAWGIEDGYWDIAGQWHDTPEPTRRALRVAMGGLADVADPPPASRPVWFVRHGTAPMIERPADLVLEDGTALRATSELPPDLPLGYHDLLPNDGGPTTRLIVTPDRCHLPDGLRTWGWSAQLYATRSRSSWGIGDLADLATLGRWTADRGGGVVGINPLHAATPGPRQEPSPYFPSSRRFRSPLYLRIEDVPGFTADDDTLSVAQLAGRKLNEQREIDRDAVYGLKLPALELLWSRFAGDPRFDAFAARGGSALRQFGAFCAIAEEHEGGWHDWPSEYRRPDSAGVARFVAGHHDRVRFHSWLQWLLDAQLANAGTEISLLGDLAIGFDPGGADSWLWQDVVAHGVRVGAPPDSFNADGQDWGLPPFVPWKLRAVGYEPVVQTLRAALEHCGALRIDHVMGLFRLFWIPADGSPADGTYVRFPDSELLDIVALESTRAGAVIVGEDLGTVEDEVRDQLAERGVLSYRLVWFEEEGPRDFPAQALAAVTTHDLPTIAGVWRHSDAQADADLEDRLVALTGLPTSASPGQVVVAAHQRLAEAPSVIVMATLDDALCVEERPNLPGTTTERPNWSLALPEPLEALTQDPVVLEVADAFRGRGD
ncbi:MAG TPA: 4-alpha-glucanotransferase [Acidimicrobiales bacterium]|nr:4-alpha-glucanotransferase [Acidimicrobiales bacterium]